MTYSPLLLAHIIGGVVAIAAGGTAMIVRKGSPLHRKAGDVFVVSMLVMAASGGYLAFVKSQPTNVIAGTFTCYLVATAWLTTARKPGTIGRGEVTLTILGLLSALADFIVGSQQPKGIAQGCYVFGVITLLSVSGDVRMAVRGGVAGAQRLVRHLWRMNFALFIATASFFLGKAGDPVLRKAGLRARLFDGIRKTHLPEVPVLFVVILTIYWLFRVWFTSAYRKPALREGQS